MAIFNSFLYVFPQGFRLTNPSPGITSYLVKRAEAALAEGPNLGCKKVESNPTQAMGYIIY